MPDLFISGINQKLLDKFTNRLNKLRAGGAKKGDKSKYTIQAIEQWLDSTTPKDRGHILLQKEIDELKAENRRLNSKDNPEYQTLRTENLELAKENYELKLNTQGKAVITIDIGQAQEVFEELCEGPMEYYTTRDGAEPPTRLPAIEAMIQQLKEIIDKEE